MALSSNSLIHFTNDKESLKGIRENNFKVLNCRESIVLDGRKSSWIIPMIGFCDIPLSEIKKWCQEQFWSALAERLA